MLADHIIIQNEWVIMQSNWLIIQPNWLIIQPEWLILLSDFLKGAGKHQTKQVCWQKNKSMAGGMDVC